MTKTIFCDIDGTIFKHKGDIYKNILHNSYISLNGINNELDDYKFEFSCNNVTFICLFIFRFICKLKLYLFSMVLFF
jgi:hypothetical protein